MKIVVVIVVYVESDGLRTLTGPARIVSVPAMMKRRWCLVFGLLCLIFCDLALARNITLNGVKIDGVRKQRFENCVVEIDALGNIDISSAAYVVDKSGISGEITQSLKPLPTDVGLNNRYWLVTEKAPGLTDYDVEFFVNGRWVRKFFDDEKHGVLEMTQYFHPGRNQVIFIAKKRKGGEVHSTSSSDIFRIVLGEGKQGGRNVVVTRTLVDYRRTAAENTDHRDEYIIIAE